jgi:hypothetical protein
MTEPDERPARYVETRPDGQEVVIYRASSIGSCERALVAAARKYTARPHPEWFQQVLDEGTAMESVIRAMFHEQAGSDPSEFIDQHLIELEVGEVDGRLIVVRAHADDVHVSDGALVREYKKFRDSSWPNFLRQGVEVHVNYPWQVSVMMHGLAQEHDAVVCEFIGGHFDGETITEVSHTLLVDPPIPLKAIIKKLARIERMVNEGLDPSEVPCQPKFPCGYWFLHDDVDKKAAAETATLPDDPKVLEAWAAWHTANGVLATAKQMVDAAETKKKGAAKIIAAAIGNATRVEHDGLELVRVQSTVPERTQVVKAHTKDYFQLPRSTKKEAS